MAWYWFLPPSGYTGASWGTTGDVAAPADYDGGITDKAVFRPLTGYWWIEYSSTSATVYAVFGTNGDKPRPNDFDGDGKADICIFRPSDSTWYWVRSSDSQSSVFNSEVAATFR